MIKINKENENYTLVSFDDETLRLNVVIADKFKNELNKIIDEGIKHLIIDFSGIKFIDSTGFGSMVTVYNHGKNRETEILLCNFSPETMELLKITKLDQVFNIYNNLDLAIKNI